MPSSSPAAYWPRTTSLRTSPGSMGPQRTDGVDLGAAHRVGGERHRRLHRGQRQHLQHVVLHHVAQRSGAVVVHRARAQPFLLGDGDLDVVDAAVVPEVLEDAVGEPQHHQVLHGLLAEIVVDAEDLALVEILAHRADDTQRAVQVVADRLLDHDSSEIGRLGRRDQSGAVELLNRLGNRLGRKREVVDAVGRQATRLFDFLQAALEAREPVGTVESREVIEVLREAVPAVLLDFQARVTLGRLARLGAKRLERHLAAREAEDCALGRDRLLAAMLEVVERGQQLARGQVARGAEDHDRARRHGMGFRDSPNLAHRCQFLSMNRDIRSRTFEFDRYEFDRSLTHASLEHWPNEIVRSR